MRAFFLSTVIFFLMSSTVAAQGYNSSRSNLNNAAPNDPPTVEVCNDPAAVCLPEEQEICDGLDNDCDTADAVGGTESWGGIVRDMEVHDAEICDGFDDDCDDYGDEGMRSGRDTMQSGRPTSRRSDARGANRSSSSTAGRDYNSSRSNNSSRTASAGGGSDSDGICDGVDNDCDGVTDAADVCNDPDLNVSCSLPYGRADYRDLDSDDDGLASSAREICNGMDDDCDDYVDERATRSGEPDHVGLMPGRMNDSRGDDMAQPEGLAGAGWLDDDCDGVVDEQPGASGNLEGDPDRPVVTGRTYSGTD